MTEAVAPGAVTRTFNTLVAAAFGAFILAMYWPLVQLFDLSRADLEYQGYWIGGHTKQIMAVTPGGVAERAGLHVGDVLEFDPGRDADWVLASYREMPEGFSATLPVRHADGSRTVATLAPERVSYLPSLNDRLALLARLSALTIVILLAVMVVWARPGLMAWSLVLAMIAIAPIAPSRIYYLAFEAGHRINLIPVMALFSSLFIALVPFALCFPRDTVAGWSWWKRALGVFATLPWSWFWVRSNNVAPFESDEPSGAASLSYAAFASLCCLLALAIFWQTYRKSDGSDRARLKWAMLGMSAVLVASILATLFVSLPISLSRTLSGSGFSIAHWVIALGFGVVWPLALGYAILRQRVVDVQFAVGRTLVYGAVWTLALAAVAAVHWLLGRLIEPTQLTVGLEVLAAIGVGVALNRLTRGISRLLDRVLFRQHYQAEQRLRRVTAALPHATTERSIAEALVLEPVRHLDLASAALFYRDGSEGPLHRVLAHGWSDEHATTLATDALLVRYLQSEHKPLTLDDAQWLPDAVPQGAAHPALAIPVVNQQVLTAVTLYGAHANSTLPDPDEVALLQALAKAAAVSHRHVRLAKLTRENEAQRSRSDRLESSSAELHALLHERTVRLG